MADAAHKGTRKKTDLTLCAINRVVLLRFKRRDKRATRKGIKRDRGR
jgi:hypothetical protein